jgi:putative copper export protein
MSGEALVLAYLALAKGLTYLGFFGLVGAVAVRFVVVPVCCRKRAITPALFPVAEREICRLAFGSAALLTCAAVARLYAQTYAVFGLDESVTVELMRSVALETRWGAQWVPQFLATLFADVAVVLIVVRRGAGWWSTVVATLALAVTLPMTGHAMSYSGEVWLSWTLQVGHGVAGGLWLGTLAGVVATVRSLRVKAVDTCGQLTAALVSSFSPLAVVAVGTVMLTGAASAILYLDHWGQLWRTRYGLTLVGKVVLMFATGAVGAYNLIRLRHKLGTELGRATLIHSAGLEIALACVVLAVTAVLVHLPLPHE